MTVIMQQIRIWMDLIHRIQIRKKPILAGCHNFGSGNGSPIAMNVVLVVLGVVVIRFSIA